MPCEVVGSLVKLCPFRWNGATTVGVYHKNKEPAGLNLKARWLYVAASSDVGFEGIPITSTRPRSVDAHILLNKSTVADWYLTAADPKKTVPLAVVPSYMICYSHIYKRCQQQMLKKSGKKLYDLDGIACEVVDWWRPMPIAVQYLTAQLQAMQPQLALLCAEGAASTARPTAASGSAPPPSGS